MSVVRLTPGMLGPRLKQDGQSFAKALRGGLRNGAKRGQAHLVRETPVYLGQMKAGWRDSETGQDEHKVENIAPHAGIIERGALPHGVSAEGREAITRYMELVAGVDRETAQAMAAGYIKKLEVEGQEGKFIVRDNLDQLRDFVTQETERLLGSIK